jgi:hypothetical protein
MSGPALERVGARDPMRCQKSNGNTACFYKCVPGSTFCNLHGGGATGRALEKKQLRNIILQGELGTRAQEMLTGGRLKDLTDEVVLSRVMLEGLLKNIKAPTDFIIYADKVNTTLKTTQSLIESLQKIQEKNKELVDRATLFTIAEAILGVITAHVSDPDEQRAIGEEIYAVVIKGLGGEVPGES